MAKNTKPMRINPEVEQRLKIISAERFSHGLDKVQLSPGRIAEAALNIPNVLQLLKTSQIKNDKK